MNSQLGLFDAPPEPYTVEPFMFWPEDVAVEPTTLATIKTLQGRMGKGSKVWKPSPGRQLPMVVTVCGQTVGLMLLSSTVLNLKARDARLDLPKDPSEKGKALRNYMDLAVAIGAQPIAWHWNIGKLIAMLAPTLTGEYYEKFGDSLEGITTTSLWGKSSQYNRVYEFLGYTGGHGYMHIPKPELARMTAWCREHEPEAMAKLSAARKGPMSMVALYCSKSGDLTWTTLHGRKRGIYYHDTDPKVQRADVIDAWWWRWGFPRYLRTKDQQAPYADGVTWHKEQLVP
jgi:hypothetical protein